MVAPCACREGADASIPDCAGLEAGAVFAIIGISDGLAGGPPPQGKEQA